MTALCEVQDDSLSRLKGLFQRIDLSDWASTWRKLVAADQVRDEIRIETRRIISLRHAPWDWQDDIEHETMIVLARRLRTNPDLAADPEQIETKFRAWLGTIIANACFHAYRSIYRLYRREVALPDDYDRAEYVDIDLLERCAEVSLELDKLDLTTQTALRLYGEGYFASEIATLLDLHHQPTYRLVKRGLRRLCELLEDA